ncbi:MAG: PD-(D/E)XK nuclease family protein [Candidatus Woesearchaeota archaeon]
MINKIKTHNKKNNLSFDAKHHKYFVNGVEFKSVTKTLSKYFPFEREKIADELAKRNSVSKKEILRSWDEVKDNGSLVHDLIDGYLKNKELSSDELIKIKPAIDFLKENNYEILASEIRVFSSKFKVAGTIDLLVKDSKGNILIFDWKTNKKNIDKKEVFEMAKHPFSEFPNNKFYLYSMQLSFYSLILKEEYGIEVYDCFLIHLSDTFKVIDILNLKPDLLDNIYIIQK